MAVYYFAVSLSCIISLSFSLIYEFKKNGKLKYLAAFLSAIPMFILASIRYGVGTDYFNYIKHFYLAQKGIAQKEILYVLINKVVGDVGLEYQWVHVVCSLIFFSVLYKHIYDISPYPALSIFLVVGMTHYFAYQNIVRQMIAGVIVMYGMRYIERKQFFRFCICILVGIGFHKSCILFLLLYWYDFIKINPFRILCLTGIVLAIREYISLLVLSFIKHTGMSWYIGSKYDSDTVGYVYLLVQFSIILLASIEFNIDKEALLIKRNILMKVNNEEIEDKQYKLYYTAQALNLWIAIFSGNIPLIDRFRNLFGLPAIILIPLSIKRIKFQPLRILVIVVIVFCFLIYSYLVTTSGNHGALPYRTVFNKYTNIY